MKLQYPSEKPVWNKDVDLNWEKLRILDDLSFEELEDASKILDILAQYASCKHLVMRMRRDGNDNLANYYETDLIDLYCLLPKWMNWDKK
jgi:hypothetical protein